MKERLLVISPHADDETFGCGGLIDKVVKAGGKVYVFVCANGTVLGKDTKEGREDEFRKAMDVLGVDYYSFSAYADRHLRWDAYPVIDLAQEIENIIKDWQPTTVAVPFGGSYNQDHKIVYDASLIALRPTNKNASRIKVIEYEQPFYISWAPYSFKPNYFVDISDNLKTKLEALSLYKSQNTVPGWTESIARLRGHEIGVKAAEAYRLVKEVV